MGKGGSCLRVEFTFTSKNEIVLPIHHNHILQGFIYNSFSDKSFATFLHDQGYKWNKRNFKLFTYSRLMGKYKINNQKKEIVYQPPVCLVISSIKDEIIQDLTANIIKKSWLQLGKQQVFMDNLRLETYSHQQDELTVNMLSPVVTYHTVIEDGKKKTHYFSPWDGEFSEQIKNNLLKKYEIIHGESIQVENFTIKALFNKKNKPNIVLFRGFVIKGWMGKFKLSAASKLLELAFDAGIGAKNSMGQGCFEIV